MLIGSWMHIARFIVYQYCRFSLLLCARVCVLLIATVPLAYLVRNRDLTIGMLSLLCGVIVFAADCYHGFLC